MYNSSNIQRISNPGIPGEMHPLPVPAWWGYNAGNDTTNDVLVDDYFKYFANYNDNNLQIFTPNIGDEIYCRCSNGVILLIIIQVYPIIKTIAVNFYGTFLWHVITDDTNMLSNNGYIINGSGVLVVRLPVTAIPGDIVEVAGFSGSGWDIDQNSGQRIHFIGNTTTTGVSGGLASNNQYDSVKLINVVANTDWLVLTSEGNITII